MHSKFGDKSFFIALVAVVIASALITKLSVLITGVTV